MGFATVSVFNFSVYKDKGRLDEFYTYNLVLILIQSFLTIVSILLLFCFSNLLVNNSTYSQVFEEMLFLVLPGILCNQFSIYIESLLYYNFGYIKYRNILEFARIGLLNLVFIIFIHFFKTVQLLPIIYSLVAIVIFVVNIINLNRIEPIYISLKYLRNSIGYITKNLGDSISFWILGVSSVVVSQTDVLFISILKTDVGLITLYSQSFRLQDIALKFIKKLTEIKAPKILGLYQQGNHRAVYEIYSKLLLTNIILASIVCVVISFVGKYVLEIWLDHKIIFDQNLIMVLSFICISSSVHYVMWNFCNLTGLQKKVRKAVIVEVVVNISLSYFLIKYWGLIGLGLATILASLVSITYIYFHFRKYKKRAI